ncbi:MAG: M20/M25/M40 family metallo-hydrolase [Pseudoclavibacter sp.]
MDLSLLLADLRLAIETESPSVDLDAVARSATVIGHVGEDRLGVLPETLIIDARTHLRWRFGTGPRRVLLVAHHDTVWPLGSLATRPFEITGDVLRGPGCFDMKAGVIMAIHALASLDDLDGVTLLVTGDEELGSPSSRALIEEEARAANVALVLESAEHGAVKIERKGVSLYDVAIEGRAAHAGLEPEIGINATLELSRQALRISEIARGEQGTTVTPTVAQSGTSTNTVPAHARLSVDARAWSLDEQERVDRAMRALSPATPGAGITVSGGINRPALEHSMSGPVYARLLKVLERIGVPDPGIASVGGGSDANVTAGVGTPTLDGLGATGAGSHAEHEHVIVSDLIPRTHVLAALVADLRATPLGPIVPGERTGRHAAESPRAVPVESAGMNAGRASVASPTTPITGSE